MIVVQVGARGVFRSVLGYSIGDTLAELVGFSSIFGVLWLLLRVWRKRQFSSLGFQASGWVAATARGAAIGLVTSAATAVAIMVFGATVHQGAWRTEGVRALVPGLLTLLATVVQSSSEEALFRGWLFPAIGNRLGIASGLIISSSVFMLAHATTGPPPLGWFNLFLFGCLAALLTLAEGGLWAASAWHSVWNWTEGGLLGFSVDSSMHPGLIAAVRATGPNYVTGGTFGPEGGIVVTGVLLASVVVMLRKLRMSPTQ